VLRARRPDRNDHDPVRGQLLQERRRDMVDAAGDDDLVEGGEFLPAVVAVGVAGANRAIFAVAARHQPIVQLARARGERRDDFDRPDMRREVGEIGGLVA